MKKCRHASCTVVITLLKNFSLASACQFRASCQLMAISSGTVQLIGAGHANDQPTCSEDEPIASDSSSSGHAEQYDRPCLIGQCSKIMTVIHNLKNVIMIEGKPFKPSWENDAALGGWYAMDNKISDILEKKKKEKYRWHMKEVPTNSRHYYDLKNMTQYIQHLTPVYGGNEWKTITGNDGSGNTIGMGDWKMRRIYQEVTFSYKLKQKIKKIHGGRRFLLDLQEEDSSLTYGPLKSKKEKYKTEKKQAGMQVKKKSMKVKKVKQA